MGKQVVQYSTIDRETIRAAGFIQESIVDGPGLRFVVFAQGCPHHCAGCHNPDTHDFQQGHVLHIEDVIRRIKANPLLDGVTLSGGEPFSQAEVMAELAKRVKQLGLHVMTYTGYSYEAIIAGSRFRPEWGALLHYTDILVDGKFELELRSPLLPFRGSSNQRLIDAAQSLKTGQLELVDL